MLGVWEEGPPCDSMSQGAAGRREGVQIQYHIYVILYYITRNTCTQQPLARFSNLFSVMLRLHTANNRADFVSWWML